MLIFFFPNLSFQLLTFRRAGPIEQYISVTDHSFTMTTMTIEREREKNPKPQAGPNGQNPVILRWKLSAI